MKKCNLSLVHPTFQQYDYAHHQSSNVFFNKRLNKPDFFRRSGAARGFSHAFASLPFEIECDRNVLARCPRELRIGDGDFVIWLLRSGNRFLVINRGFKSASDGGEGSSLSSCGEQTESRLLLTCNLALTQSSDSLPGNVLALPAPSASLISLSAR
jgi:hypothetical protein